MELIPEFEYNTLSKGVELKGIKEFKLCLSSPQAVALKKIEKRINKYQLSSALESNSIRTALNGFLFLISEMWGMFRYQNLCEVRAMFIGGQVESVSYVSDGKDKVLVHINLKEMSDS
jgi:hypothetical protein